MERSARFKSSLNYESSQIGTCPHHYRSGESVRTNSAGQHRCGKLGASQRVLGRMERFRPRTGLLRRGFAHLVARRYDRLPLPSISPTTPAFNVEQRFRHSVRTSHSDPAEVCVFEARLRFAFATTCCFAYPPVGGHQTSVRPTRAFTSGLSTIWSPARRYH